MCKRIEKEIEFYKDLFSKTFTAFLLTSGGTLTAYHKEGLTSFVIEGTIASAFLLISVLLTGYLYKREIRKLED
jgi:hypothetical protein